jgi:TolA-binding protein
MLDIAHARFNQKRYRDAAGAYEAFLRRWPVHAQRPLALYHAGLCYLRLDRAGDAVDRWEALVKDSASSPLAERAWARAGDAYFQAERYADASRAYRGLLEHFAGSPAAALASLRLAQCEYNAGRDAAALEAYATTIARYPGTPIAREAGRGQELALYRLSQTADGAATLARLVEQYPTSGFAADAMFQIGKRSFREKKWTEAAESFRQVVSRFPGFSSADQAQLLLAEAHEKAGAADASRAAYEQFLAFFPESPLRSTVHFRLGLVRFQAKDYLQAGIDFTRALEDSNTKEVRTASRYNLALCHRLLGRHDEALVELERYRADFPNDARAGEVAYQLGDVHETAGRLAEAAREFETAGSSSAGAIAVESWYRLGRLREGTHDIDGALKAYARAAQDPDRDQPFRLSAVARQAALYESRREMTKALTAYKDIVRNARDRELAAAAAGRVSQLEKKR